MSAEEILSLLRDLCLCCLTRITHSFPALIMFSSNCYNHMTCRSAGPVVTAVTVGVNDEETWRTVAVMVDVEAK